jgi:probable rRNA maturation factor
VPESNWNSIYHKLKIELKNTGLLQEKIDRGKVKRLIREILKKENKKLGVIELIFLKDKEILKINREFLKHDYFTDVITFDYNRKSEISGDVCIGVDSVSRNAFRYKTNFSEELIRVIIHGVLHLIGFTDKDPAEKSIMRKREDLYLGYYKTMENGNEL